MSHYPRPSALALPLVAALLGLALSGCGDPDPGAASDAGLEADASGFDGAIVDPDLGSAGEDQASQSGPAPAIETLQPPVGPTAGGTIALVRGSGFRPGAKVYLGDKPAEVLKEVDSGRLTIRTPGGDKGAVTVKVVNPDGGETLLEGAFTYADSSATKLTLSKLLPGKAKSSGGTVILMQGSGFQAGALIFVDWLPREGLEITTPQTGLFTTPKLPVGTWDVAITNPDGQSAEKATGLEVVDPSKLTDPAPKIDGVKPASVSAKGGDTVTLTGSGFVQGSLLLLGGQQVDSWTVESGEKGTLKTDATEPGAYGLTLSNPDGQSYTWSKKVFFWLDMPSVWAVDPASGALAGGETVTVKGSNFVENMTVSFGAAACGEVKLVDAGSLTCVTPKADKIGPVDVTVLTPGGLVGFLPAAFNYNGPDPDPKVTKVVPDTGVVEGGVVVAVEGDFFQAGSTVWFGDTKADKVLGWSPKHIAVELPAGKAGKVDVTVKTEGFKDGVLTAGFTYTEQGPPAVKEVVPSTGPTTGGIIVLVKGENLRPESKVFFGGKAAPTSYVTGPEAIGVLLPKGDAGAVDVVVKTAGFADAELKAGFEYKKSGDDKPQLMAVAQVQPNQGPTTGGHWALIKGVQLPLGAKVFFGGKVSSEVVAISSDLLTARVPPAAAAGKIDVSVQDPATLQVSTLPGAYSYYEPKDAADKPPKLLAIKPAIGPSQGDTLAMLLGENIKPGALAFVGGRPGSDLVVVDDKLASFRTPPGKPGPASVMIVNNDGQFMELNSAFVYSSGGKPSLTVSGVLPVQGTAAGGTGVLITGSGFSPGAQVFLDGLPVDSLLKGPTSLTFTSPKHAPGLVSVQVTAPDGWTAELTDAFNFILEAPFVGAVSPDWGPPAGKTEVLITGQGLHPKATVKFGDAEAEVISGSGGSLKVKAPAGKLGKVDVTVINPDFLTHSLKDGFTYSETAPGQSVAIAQVAPDTGPAAGGNTVVIVGNGFVKDVSVIVGTQIAPKVLVIDDQTLQVTMPKGTVGAAPVKVVVAGVGTAEQKAAYFYYDAASKGPFPKVSAVSPGVGPTSGGTIARVTVVPAPADAKVFFGGLEAKLLGADEADALVVETPAHLAGPVRVSVMLADGKAHTVQGAFTYYEPAANTKSPVITQVQPTAGSSAGGEGVNVIGTGFVAGTLAFAGYRPMTDVKTPGATNLSGTTPPHPSGLVDIAITRPDGFSAVLAASFAYNAPSPVVEVIFPSVGHIDGGLTVVLSGKHFEKGAKVFFGSTQSKKVVVAASHVLSAEVPPTAKAGKVSIEVLNPDGKKGMLKDAFSYLSGQFTNPAPEVLDVVPNNGPFQGGTVLAIYGKDFQTGAQVLFGGKPAQVHLVDPGLVTVTTPAGYVGPVDVTVLNPDGQGDALGSGFSYKSTTLPPPGLLGITPPSGPETGSTSVILSGAQLTGGGLGFVGYRPLSSWTVLNSAIATGTTSKGSGAGAVDVVVTNGDGQSATLSGGYVYVGAPKIQGINPSMGAVAGGTVVHVAGTNFAKGATVEFAGKKVGSAVVLSAFVIKVQTAPGDPGPAQVKVTNPDGQFHIASLPFLYVLPPEVGSVFPGKGTSLGGTPVIIRGKHFLKGVKVTFGKTPAAEVHVISDTVLTVRTPMGNAGDVVAVTVENPDGQSAIHYKAFLFVDPKQIGPMPEISALEPATGPTGGGTWGLLHAKNLQPGAQALFGLAPTAAFEVVGDGLGRFVSAPSEVTAVVDVTVLHPDGGHGLLKGGFKYTDPSKLGPAPKLTSFEPDAGPTKGGSIVSIVGTGMSGTAWAFFDTVPAIKNKVIDTGLDTTTPKHALGVVDVTVTNAAGRSTTAKGAFTYLPPPKVLTADPKAGPGAGGTFVKVTGEFFVPAKDGKDGAKVMFCTDYALSMNCVLVPTKDVVVKSDKLIELTTPQQVPGMNDLVVVNPDGQAAAIVKAFLFRPPPKITEVNPDKGTTLGGTVVKLVGVGFQPGLQVLFGKEMATDVNVVDGSNVTCKAPAGDAGPVTVTVKNPDLSTHTIGGGFLYLAPPKVLTVFPTLGPESGGTKVTIQGSGFVTGVKGSKVLFGTKAVPEKDLKVESNSLISVVTPAGSGPVAVKIINPDDQFDAKAGGFVYIPVVQPPSIKYIQPDFGPTSGGYLTNLIGTGFLQGAQVAFGSDASGWSKSESVKVLNAGTLIVAVVPAHAKGKVDVKVTNSDGQSGTLKESFEYSSPQGLPGLAFLGITPTRGPASGGYEVIIYGQGFKSGVTVFFGSAGTSTWVKADQVTRLGPTVLKVTMPDYGKNGPADVRVVNPALGGLKDEVVGSTAFVFGQSVVFEPFGHRLPIDRSKGDYDTAIFDANGDGLNDVLILHDTSGDDLLINTKDDEGRPGKFIDQSSTNLPSIPTYCRYRRLPLTWDVDKDGDVDVVFRSYNHHLCWYKNKGDGTFTVHDIGYFPNLNNSSGMARGDVNCDGIDDIFVATTDINFLLIGDGKGGFKQDKTALPNHNEPSRDVALGDVDKDGDLDALIANDNAFQNRLYYNNCNNVAKGQPWSFTDATYGTGKNFPVSGFNSKTALLEDINGDGWLDALILNWGQTDRLYFNKTGNFLNDDGLHFPQNEKFPNSAQGWFVDVDNDGDMDLVVKKNVSSDRYWPSVYLNDKAQGGASVFTDASPVNMPEMRGELAQYMGVGDLNADGLVDIYVTKRDQQDWLFLNHGYKEDVAMTEGNRVPKGAFANNTFYGMPEDAYDTYNAAAGDIDGDGDIDLVMNTHYGQWTRIWVNDGAGNFFDHTTQRIKNSNCHQGDLLLVDLNGDKDLDILQACYYYSSPTPNGGGLRQWANDGKGNFTETTSPNMPEGHNTARYYSLAAGDLDNDGDQDLLVVGETWAYRMMVNGGDPFNTDGAYFFTKNEWINPNTSQHKAHALIADLNGDKHRDIYIGMHGQNQLWYNQGTGMQKNVSYSHLPSVSTTSRRVLANDFDKDGDVDLFVINNGDNRLHVGELDFKYADVTVSHLPSGLGANHTGGALADLDLDGFVDVFSTVYAGHNQLLLNQGDAHFGNFSSALPADSDESRCVVLADFDNDGRTDAFICNLDANRIYMNKTPKPKK